MAVGLKYMYGMSGCRILMMLLCPANRDLYSGRGRATIRYCWHSSAADSISNKYSPPLTTTNNQRSVRAVPCERYAGISHKYKRLNRLDLRRTRADDW